MGEVLSQNEIDSLLQALSSGELDAEDMQKIAALDTAHSLFLDHHSGETTKQFMEWRAVVKPTE